MRFFQATKDWLSQNPFWVFYRATVRNNLQDPLLTFSLVSLKPWVAAPLKWEGSAKGSTPKSKVTVTTSLPCCCFPGAIPQHGLSQLCHQGPSPPSTPSLYAHTWHWGALTAQLIGYLFHYNPAKIMLPKWVKVQSISTATNKAVTVSD